MHWFFKHNKYLLFLVLNIILCQHVVAQRVKVYGQVVDEKGLGLPGVNVIMNSSTKGTVTDLDGKFDLFANKSDKLTFSMLGMESQTIVIGDKPFINVTLSEEEELLDEVVVTGFQVVDRKLFTGSAARVAMKDVKIEGLADVSRSLEGQVAGVSVDNVSGTFGSSPRIRIRGNASINGSNAPLFVVDGVILEDLANITNDDLISGDANTLISSSVANLNPDDIESFQVLKDASATAIYGGRAANGVIVITTKRGKSGDLRVSYSGNYSGKIRPTYRQFNILNSQEEMEIYREMVNKGIIDIATSVRAQNYGVIGKHYAEVANRDLEWGTGGTINEDFLNRYENINTDWFDVLFRDFGLQQQHSLSFTAGNEKSNSYYSIGYLNDQGQTIADVANRITGMARNTYYISDKFTFGLKLSASYRDQRVPGTRNREFDPITGEFSRGFDINPFSFALNTSRSISAYEENGDHEIFRRNYTDFNILDELRYNFIDIEVLDISGQTDFEIHPKKDLVINGVIQARFGSTIRDHTVNENSNQAEAYRANQTQFIQDQNNLLFKDPNNPGLNPTIVLPQGGFNYLDQNVLVNLQSRVNVQWSKSWNQVHEMNLFSGGQIEYTNRDEQSTTGLGVVYESGGVVVTDPNIIEFFNLQNIDYFEVDQSRDRAVGLFLNGGYAYRSKYVANFIVRYDGSNRLGRSRNARFLPTWNISGAWNIDKEYFFKSSFLDRLGVDYMKLRATYGLSGNRPERASAQLNLESDITIRPTDVEPFLNIRDLTNDDLTWEKLYEFNVGLDVGLWKGRLTSTAEFFERNSFDLIGDVVTSGIGGQILKNGNFANLRARGFEFSISSVNIKTKKFAWSTSFNLGYTQDWITKLDFGPRYTDAISDNGTGLVGFPRLSLFSTRFAGLDQQGLPTFYDGEGAIVRNLDLQRRENILQILKYEGSSEPRGAGGFTNTVRYKNWSMNVLFTYKFDYVLRLNSAFRSEYTDFSALPGELKDRWAVPGDEFKTNIPAIVDSRVIDRFGNIDESFALYNLSDVRVARGDYVRLKNVRLNYSFPVSMTTKLGLQSLRLSLEAQNLALLFADRRLNGQDPEFISSGGVSLPQPKMITATLNVGF